MKSLPACSREHCIDAAQIEVGQRRVVIRRRRSRAWPRRPPDRWPSSSAGRPLFEEGLLPVVETQSFPDLAVRESAGAIALNRGIFDDIAADRLGGIAPLTCDWIRRAHDNVHRKGQWPSDLDGGTACKCLSSYQKFGGSAPKQDRAAEGESPRPWPVSFAGRIRRTISWGELDYESPRINFNEDLCAATETGLLLHPTAGKLDGDTLEETNAPLTREPAVSEFRGSALRRGRRGGNGRLIQDLR